MAPASPLLGNCDIGFSDIGVVDRSLLLDVAFVGVSDEPIVWSFIECGRLFIAAGIVVMDVKMSKYTRDPSLIV